MVACLPPSRDDCDGWDDVAGWCVVVAALLCMMLPVLLVAFRVEMSDEEMWTVVCVFCMGFGGSIFVACGRWTSFGSDSPFTAATIAAELKRRGPRANVVVPFDCVLPSAVSGADNGTGSKPPAWPAFGAVAPDRADARDASGLEDACIVVGAKFVAVAVAVQTAHQAVVDVVCRGGNREEGVPSLDGGHAGAPSPGDGVDQARIASSTPALTHTPRRFAPPDVAALSPQRRSSEASYATPPGASPRLAVAVRAMRENAEHQIQVSVASFVPEHGAAFDALARHSLPPDAEP